MIDLRVSATVVSPSTRISRKYLLIPGLSLTMDDSKEMQIIPAIRL